MAKTATRPPMDSEAPARREGGAGISVDHPRARLLTFLGVLAAIFLSALDQTIVGTALPKVIGELNGLDYYTWVTTVYLLTATAVVPVVGKLSEQLGRKRVFLTGIVVFLVGSALCGAAQDMTQLIAFRGLQGVGGGILTGTAFAVIADLFAPAERAKYTGLVAGMFGVASIVGPLVGGYLTDNVTWRAIFYVNIPVGAAVLALLWFTFPRIPRHGHPRIDYIGALGLASGAAMLTLGASLAGTHDWSYPPVWFLLVAGAVAMVGTIIYEARFPEAIFPPQLFRNSIFALSLGITFVSGLAMFGAIIYIPLFLQGVVGVKATNSGLLMLPMMGGMVVGSIGGGLLLTRIGRYKVQATVGIACMVVSMYLLTLLTVDSTQWEVSRDVILFGFGLGLNFAVFNVVAQNAVESRFVSSATSALQFVRQIGGVLGLAVLGSLVTQTLKEKVQTDVPPSALLQVPAGMRDQVTNPEKFFSAQFQDAVNQFIVHSPNPGAAGATFKVIRDGVRMALADSIHVAFEVGFVLLLLALVLSLFVKEIPLRRTSAMEDRNAARAAAAESGAAV
jgi:EmrB/QacA subfamily drug resistance transporter